MGMSITTNCPVPVPLGVGLALLFGLLVLAVMGLGEDGPGSQ